MEYRAHFEAVRRRPQMYGVDGSYGQFCAYLAGVDAGNDGRLLTGFRELLVTRLGGGNNLVWRGLVIHLARPDGGAVGREAVESAERDPMVIAKLFELLDEFLELTASHGGVVQIFDEYTTWLHAQSWYRPPTRPATTERALG